MDIEMIIEFYENCLDSEELYQEYAEGIFKEFDSDKE